MDTVRIRLVFEEQLVLSKTHRKDGLKRSWILLKPHLASVADFSSHLLDLFLLRDACPDGVILSMDDFILPPFESTSILKDKDIVRVKKKVENVSAFEKIHNGPFPFKTEDGMKDKLIPVDGQLINEEIVKEFGDCKYELDEYEVYNSHQLQDTQINKKVAHRKRRALKTLRSSKYISIHIYDTIANAWPNDIVSNMEALFLDQAPCSWSDLNWTNKSTSASTAKRLLASAYLQQARTRHNHKDLIFSEKNLVKKRKSPNHHCDTENSKKKNIKQQIVEKSSHKLPDKNYFEDSEQLAGSSDNEEIVPVVIRPGHIRFKPLPQVTNHSVHPVQTSMETLHWSGVTMKKSEQKWRKEKSSSWKSNCKYYEGEYSTLQVRKDLTTENCPIDFNKLRPCASLPERGDIIAYRLIELSSSWTPELSSFRVGKVIWFKPEANKIVLIPVPKHPFVFKKVTNEDSAEQVDTSPYGKDGSLKADYSSLIDIRIVEHRRSNCLEAGAVTTGEVSHTNQSWNKWENLATAQENGNENAWDKILQASSAKKTKLSKEV